MTYVNNMSLGDLSDAIRSLTRWVDGFFGSDIARDGEADHTLRIHRDGAIALATRIEDDIDQPIWPTRVSRIVNSAILYLTWVWERFALSRPVELHVAFHNVRGRVFEIAAGDIAHGRGAMLVEPPSLNADPIVVVHEVLPWDLSRASVRHQLVLRFADRLHQALGLPQADVPFRLGALHDRVGEMVNVSVGTDVIVDHFQAGAIATIWDGGAVTSSRTGQAAAWFIDGVLMDLRGNAIAVLELAPGTGCPDDFVGRKLAADPGAASAALGLHPRQVLQRPADPPPPTGRWSSQELRATLHGEETPTQEYS